jgi:hypothetical protein
MSITGLTVMQPTPIGFRYPGLFRVLVKTVLIVTLLIALLRGLPDTASTVAVQVALLTAALIVALMVMWFTDRGRRSAIDRLLGLDVIGIRSMKPIPH